MGQGPVDIPVGTRQSANQHLAVSSAPAEYRTLENRSTRGSNQALLESTTGIFAGARKQGSTAKPAREPGRLVPASY